MNGPLWLYILTQSDPFSLVFPWRIVRVNLTGLRLRSKQDFILVSDFFLRCGHP